MYGRVKQKRVSGPRGEAIALLQELQEARERASNTYDLGPFEFVPENWHERLDRVLSAETPPRKRA